jgi:ABC-type multidrug transport system ATPase subunit
MTAILGPSGCGKTSCLNCVAGRVSKKNTISSESKILYDGHTATSAYLRRNVGYVEQEDTLLGFMTPYEMLLYTAELKHPRHQSGIEKRDQVNALIDKLALGDCKDTLIGTSARRGISGGESKRTNIGIALITSPEVLYIDELTSGLDSFTGHEVAIAVKALALGGMTVAASLHSPPSHTFDLFDRILLLQRGRVVYFGDNGAPVMEYFSANFPSLRAMRRSEGVADWLLDVTTRANYDVKQAAVFADVYAASDLYRTNLSSTERLCVHVEAPHLTQGENGVIIDDAGSYEHTSVVNPMWWALFIMFRYRTLKSYRQVSFISPRLFDKVMIVFLVVTLWW